MGNALILPYLQHATPTMMSIFWETAVGLENHVEWGETQSLGRKTVGTIESDGGMGVLNHVVLNDLQPNKRYYYQVHSEQYISQIYHFKTPPQKGSEEPFQILAMSDMQKDAARPEQYAHLIQDGILPYLEDSNPDLAQALALVLIPGDLVDNGWIYTEWYNDFFGPSAPLFHHVPVYPVPGNHEGNSPLFWRYFQLPENGSVGYEEHWWYHDYNNVRIVGLDSNTGYRVDVQLDWLTELLSQTCQDIEIDFLFAQLHHPYLSELWTPGESDFTGEVIQTLEEFTEQCGKPSIHFFGHTHGYSRGQSQDHRHLWVNVASAGGSLDRWGEQSQQDYEEFSVSSDEYGFVMVEVQPGDAPSFSLKRVSMGTPENPKDNELIDELFIQLFNDKPQTPSLETMPTGLLPATGLQLQGSSFQDPDQDLHGATQWELHNTCSDFTSPLFAKWVQHENRYMGQDQQQNTDLSLLSFPDLESNKGYCLRFRYRDQGLVWSNWSEGVDFSTEP